MFTTELSLETLHAWAATPQRPGSEHLPTLPSRRHPPPAEVRRHPRGVAAATLARAARRLDGDAARHAMSDRVR